MATQYDMFFYWLGEKESGDLKRPGITPPHTQYKKVNPFGYLGKYQMGEDILKQAGYYIPEAKVGSGDSRIQRWAGKWTGKRGIKSREDFLNNPEAQEYIVRESMRLRWKVIMATGLHKFIGKDFRGIRITESELLAGVHLVGAGQDKGRDNTNKGLAAMFFYDKVVRDGNGVEADFYIKIFGGFQTPFDLDPTLSHSQQEFRDYLRNGKKPSLRSDIDTTPRVRPTHYIWRSRDDKKVRPGHAANDDKIFAVHGSPQPPNGLPPGTEPGCRCWAEWIIDQRYPLEP